MLQIVPRILCYHVGEQKTGNQVRKRHQSVQRIGYAPYQLKPDYRRKYKHKDPEEAVREERYFPKQVLQAALAVVGPAKNRGVGKGDDADDKHGTAQVRNPGEGHCGQLAAGEGGLGQRVGGVCGASGSLAQQTAYQHKACNQTHDYRVPKGSCGSD